MPLRPIKCDVISSNKCENWDEFINVKEECRKLREKNSKLEIELKEARELETSHRYHLLASREMIGNLQETVSQLVYLKRDNKRLKDEICSKDATIFCIEKDKDNIVLKHNENVVELKEAHEKQIEDLISENERKFQQAQNESDAKVAQFKCVIEELRSKNREMEAEHRDKINVVVLEYEEKMQHSAAQVAQLQEQLVQQTARTQSNLNAYRQKLAELEEQLKQTQFKQYLAKTTYPSLYGNQVDRPYTASRDTYPNAVDLESNFESPKRTQLPSSTQNKPTSSNTHPVLYYGNKTNVLKNPDKKGPFNITKKRKLYNEKEFRDF